MNLFVLAIASFDWHAGTAWVLNSSCDSNSFVLQVYLATRYMLCVSSFSKKLKLAMLLQILISSVNVWLRFHVKFNEALNQNPSSFPLAGCIDIYQRFSSCTLPTLEFMCTWRKLKIHERRSLPHRLAWKKCTRSMHAAWRCICNSRPHSLTILSSHWSPKC